MSRQANYFYEHPAYSHFEFRSGAFLSGLTVWATGLIGLAALCVA